MVLGIISKSLGGYGKKGAELEDFDIVFVKPNIINADEV